MSSPDTNKIPRRAASYPREPQNYQTFRQKNFLQRMPFTQRYRKALIIGGGVLSFCIFYSAPIYYFFRTPPENVDPNSLLWYGERITGKTYVEQYRERVLKRRQQKAEAEERLKATQASG